MPQGRLWYWIPNAFITHSPPIPRPTALTPLLHSFAGHSATCFKMLRPTRFTRPTRSALPQLFSSSSFAPLAGVLTDTVVQRKAETAITKYVTVFERISRSDEEGGELRVSLRAFRSLYGLVHEHIETGPVEEEEEEDGEDGEDGEGGEKKAEKRPSMGAGGGTGAGGGEAFMSMEQKMIFLFKELDSNGNGL